MPSFFHVFLLRCSIHAIPWGRRSAALLLLFKFSSATKGSQKRNATSVSLSSSRTFLSTAQRTAEDATGFVVDEVACCVSFNQAQYYRNKYRPWGLEKVFLTYQIYWDKTYPSRLLRQKGSFLFSSKRKAYWSH